MYGLCVSKSVKLDCLMSLPWTEGRVQHAPIDKAEKENLICNLLSGWLL